MKASIVLEDKSIFEGESFGFSGEKGGEVVFNTSLTGYQEILTDPSYRGQILVMTYPEIGNYGINDEDMESSKCHLEGLIVKEASRIYSNFRAKMGLGEFLEKHRIIGITGVDTRALTRKIRETGAMRGYIACGEYSRDYLFGRLENVPSMVGLNLADEVSTEKIYRWSEKSPSPSLSRQGRGESPKKIVVIDCGVKFNILRRLARDGSEVMVVPSKTGANEIMEMKPDGVVLSNGPGDPAVVNGVVKTATALLGKLPIFGICLGHQILALALGGKTYKLKFGHRGANHPVKNLKTGFVEITSQNHGFAVDPESLTSVNRKKYGDVHVTHLNLNDQTVEGIECETMRAYSVQYHPEASPGPHDADYLFNKFSKV